MTRVLFGRIHADHVTFDESIERIVSRARRREGGFVVTPNVDHVVLAQHDGELRAAYSSAFLSVADGMPLLWMARLFGTPLPAKISGSDLTLPLVAAAAEAGVGVFLLGASPESCRGATRTLEAQCPGVRVLGHCSPDFAVDGDDSAVRDACSQVRSSGAGLVLVAMGCPKQEVLMYRYRDELGGAVAIGIGGTLRFLAGEIDRCPPWMAGAGLEWLYRLAKEPRRLAHRYLVRDREIFAIAWRQWRSAGAVRVGSGRVDRP